MIYITGDCHAEWNRFSTENFPEQKEMTRDDYVIVCGDFGIWDDSKRERWWLDWFAEKNFTLLFCDGNHECMHKDTEILTTVGWVGIKDVYENYEDYLVASVNQSTHAIEFSKPMSRVKKHASKLIDFEGSNYRQCVTSGHDIFVDEKKMKAFTAAQLDLVEHDFRFHVNTENTNIIDVSPELIEVLTTIIMDGTVVDYRKYDQNSNKVRIQFHLKKERKITYLQGLLDANSIKYTCRKMKDDTTYINIYGDDARYLYEALGRKKIIPNSWKNLNEEQFLSFVRGLSNTDGRQLINSIVWRTVSKHNVDIVMELCVRHNWDICVNELHNASGYKKGRAQYHVSIGKGKRINHKIKIKEIEYNDDVYCLTMNNGTLVTRYKMTPCITGNCFDRLYGDEFEVVDFHGGKAHKIRENVYHLMRGHVFDLCGKKFFAFGGARSHDIQDGILDIKDYGSVEEMIRDYKFRTYHLGQMLRINHVSWWEQEMPSREEMEFGMATLETHDNKVDFIVSHCCPQEIASLMSGGFYKPDELTLYFNEVARATEFSKWFFGHYHDNQQYLDKYVLLYEQIIRIV